jgi:hypothetical protein
MVRRILATVAVAAIAGSTLSAALAHQIDPLACAGTITAYDSPAGKFYTDDHGGTTVPGVPGPPGAEEFWVYQESNGHAGLQKGGDNQTLAMVLDHDTIETAGEYDKCNTTTVGTHPSSLKADLIIF